MKTFYVHVRLGSMFEDLYIKARCRSEAIRKARTALKGTALDHRFANFVV